MSQKSTTYQSNLDMSELVSLLGKARVINRPDLGMTVRVNLATDKLNPKTGKPKSSNPGCVQLKAWKVDRDGNKIVETIKKNGVETVSDGWFGRIHTEASKLHRNKLIESARAAIAASDSDKKTTLPKAVEAGDVECLDVEKVLKTTRLIVKVLKDSKGWVGGRKAMAQRVSVEDQADDLLSHVEAMLAAAETEDSSDSTVSGADLAAQV